jgi:hypothetical protein
MALMCQFGRKGAPGWRVLRPRSRKASKSLRKMASNNAKWIEDDIKSARTVAHGVGDEGDGLYGGMKRELIHPAGAERVDAGVGPNIRPITAMLAELEVIGVGAFAVLVGKSRREMSKIFGMLFPGDLPRNSHELGSATPQGLFRESRWQTTITREGASSICDGSGLVLISRWLQSSRRPSPRSASSASAIERIDRWPLIVRSRVGNS